ncbi:MAG: phosphopantetheine-binding protein [Bacteroidales bacterium]|nr:phosphopantetheine-binding protein [Bacteroidales bacterium]
MEEIVVKLKEQIIKTLNLEDIKVEDIDTDASLFIEGLGLDSIDALELNVLMEKEYNIKIKTGEEGKKILHSVRTMAERILEERNK